MKYFFKRALLLIITVCLSTAVFSLIAYAGETPVANFGTIFIDEFDNPYSEWIPAEGLSSGYKPTLTYGIDEGDITYMRMSATASDVSNVKSPYIYRDVNGSAGIPFSSNSRIIVQARVRLDNRGPYTRTNGPSQKENEPNDTMDKRVQFKYNMPHNASELASLRLANGSLYGGNVQGHLSLLEWQYGFPRIGTGAPWENVYTNNKTSGTDYIDRAGYWSKSWFNYEIVLDGINGKMDFYCEDESGIQPKGAAKNRTVSFKSMENTLKTLAFSFHYAPLSEFDIDYIRAYNVPLNVTANIICDNEYMIFIRNESFGIQFSAPMDRDTLMSSAVTLINKSSLAVSDVTVMYNEETRILTVTPVQPLESGQYELIFNNEVIKPVKYSENFQSIFSAVPMEFNYYTENVPFSQNVRIDGTAAPGIVLYGSYDYSGESPEGDSKYIWEISTQKDGIYTPVNGADKDSFSITDDLMNGYIRFGVKAVSQNNVEGIWIYSDAIALPSSPKAENLSVNGITAVGNTLYANYYFNDVNGDMEGKSVYTWYISDSADGVFQEITGFNSRYYQLMEGDEGKYLKVSVTPFSVKMPFEGAAVMSGWVGPVKLKLSDIGNMFTNPGFESGVLTPWTIKDSTVSLDVVSDVLHSGACSMKMSGRTANTQGYCQNINFKANKTYLVGGYAMLDNSAVSTSNTMLVYPWNNSASLVKHPYVTDTPITKGKWTLVAGVIESFADHVNQPVILTWNNDAFYVDDMYVGELKIADIQTKGVPESITIPTSGEKVFTLLADKVLNQLGTNAGLINESVVWQISGNPSGVYIDGNRLVVTERAVAGQITLNAVCNPAFLGAVQGDIFIKPHFIDIVSHGDVKPLITNAILKGTVRENAVLNFSYDYWQVEGEGDASEIKWFCSESEDGVYSKLEGVSGLSYTVPAQFAGYYFRVEILPKTENGKIGNKVITNIAAPPTKPYVSHIQTNGGKYIGAVLEGQYTYADINGDAEASSTFRWLKSDSKDSSFEVISGQTGKQYILTENDIGKYIKFEVTPVAKEAPYIGTTVVSEAVLGPAQPIALELKIKKNGNYLTGEYRYYHPHGILENNSVLRWVKNGVEIGTGASCVINSSEKGDITFYVTPQADLPPLSGKEASTVIHIGNSKSDISYGNGGGSGVITFNPIIQPPDAPATIPEVKKASCADLESHWAKEYAQWAVDNAVINSEQDLFYPERLVTRSDIILYISRLLNVNGTVYRNEFTDVSAENEIANILQAFVDKGVINRNTVFRPSDYVSRQELCKLLAISLTLPNSAAVLHETFIDAYEIEGWAIPYVASAFTSGLVKGVSENEFDPSGYVTRAQIATLLYRAHNSR